MFWRRNKTQTAAVVTPEHLITALRASNTDVLDRIATMERGMKSTITSLIAQLETLAGTVRTLRAANAQLSAKVAGLEADCAAKASQISDLTAQIADMVSPDELAAVSQRIAAIAADETAAIANPA